MLKFSVRYAALNSCLNICSKVSCIPMSVVEKGKIKDLKKIILALSGRLDLMRSINWLFYGACIQRGLLRKVLKYGID